MGRLLRLVGTSRHEDVKAAIRCGADVNEVSHNLTPLDVAIHNGDVAMVDILIKAGADVNHAHPKTGNRPVHGAVNKDLRILELLLDAGADVDGGRDTSTPLSIAAVFGKKEAYARLLAAGANPNATMLGKKPSDLLESCIGSDQWMQHQLPMEAERQKPDRNAGHIMTIMAEYPTVEEYAANNGRLILIYGMDQGEFTDPAVGKWARDLGDILRSPERLVECEERFLRGDKLEAVRRERKRIERWLAREQRRKERLALAAEGFSHPEN